MWSGWDAAGGEEASFSVSLPNQPFIQSYLVCTGNTLLILGFPAISVVLVDASCSLRAVSM